MKSKTIFLLLFLILILIVILLLRSSSQEPAQNVPVEKAEEFQNAKENSHVGIFELISSSPTGQIGVTEPITLQFSQPVSGELIYTLDPPKSAILIPGKTPTELIISPVDAWAFDTTYSLTIFQENKSVTNQNLDREYTYTFKTPAYSGI